MVYTQRKIKIFKKENPSSLETYTFLREIKLSKNNQANFKKVVLSDVRNFVAILYDIGIIHFFSFREIKYLNGIKLFNQTI
jgi:hypothetical protein